MKIPDKVINRLTLYHFILDKLGEDELYISSTKIAQLLNITPRAVEVSRYRLRKKLGLKPEVNLFDFLFK